MPSMMAAIISITSSSVNDELLDVIEMIAAIMDGMKEENAYGE